MLAGLTWSVPVAIGCLAGAGSLAGADQHTLALLVRLAGVGCVVVGGAAVPVVRWRTWRYEVREHEIDLVHGALRVKRTLIPMTRVQHVESERTVLLDFFDLRSVTVHTAAGKHRIPALTESAADDLRDRIGLLAREPDVV